ncbi:DNA-binding response regulator [Bacillus thuringiensis]|uniref:DNA-binding response regulator n=2 Tax=Bacillus TaxID=1386 RepID=A0AB36TNQ5_BACTU|nr:LytTR family DNA-binding domain-containing protein [Bacillus thuringiensis]PEE64575.1 DNA-binding response regulator [Bacillus thuringiensis]PEE88877.1 DNA-binding response regulator [Bacillus thuringiensis]PFB87250.1 DNA-binding response regulator [Bacillus thuringiensis]PFM86198.1 DNA-binding response regulator [Bacillus thuringiensis]
MENNMLKIFVCEDNIYQRNEIEQVINDYLMMMDYDAKFEFSTADPQLILSYINKEKNAASYFSGLYFLGVDLNTEMNGIQLGAEIRDRDPSAKIVFITARAELAYLTFLYKVEAMDYILKGNQVNLKSKIIDCIDVSMSRHLSLHNFEQEHILIKSGASDIKICVDDIMFFESSTTPHKVVVHLKNRTLEFYGKVKDIEKMNNNFIRCHKSFVVNKKNIKKIDRQKRIATLTDGNECFISTRYVKTLLACWS